jgi:hypothetical protein
MKGNHNDPSFILDKAIATVRDDQADPQVMQTATANAWQRISQAVGIEATLAPLNRIEGCEDVLRLLPDFEAHRLTPARAMLVADHLRECAACRVHAKANKTAESVLPWHADSVLRPRQWSFGRYALAASLVLAAVLGIGIGRSGMLAPSGYRASLESVDGTLYRVDARGEHRAQTGEQFSEGEMVRTAAGSRAMLRLRDGSQVEMSGRSELYVSVGWRNTTVHLDRGIVIVQAAKRRSGHLYVKTADAQVAVTGTIFSVNSGIKGSRVSVIEGTVHVAQAAGDTVLQAGDQVTTSASMGEVPVRDEISWSQDRDKYLALLAQFSVLEKKFESIKLPDLRYQSNLLRVVPDGTAFYAGIPNYGDALAQANQLLQQQLSQSEVLREWWQQQGPGQPHNGPDFSQVIDTVHTASQYLGNEIVFACLGGSGNRGGVLGVAQITKSGLREFLTAQIQQHNATANVHLLSPEDLAGNGLKSGQDLFVLITPEFVAASPDLLLLKDVNSRWSQPTTSSGFAQSDFGQRVASEYASGAGLLIAADLGQMARNHAVLAQADRHEGLLESSGFANAKYLIAQRKDMGSKASNTAELSFNGPRTGIASWLAAPAPIGALDFITPNAAAVGALVSKSPALMVDDLVQIASAGNANGANGWAKEQAELNLDIRNDLAASLGGEAALALDGPILPTPSWKLIVEVYDPSRLQYSIGRLVEAINREFVLHNRPELKLDEQQVGGSAFYTLRSPDPAVPVEVHYTFSDGYLVAGPSQALVQEAIRTRAKGDSISHSDKFRALLPVDQHANVSGLIYQNLAPVIAPISGQISAAQLQALQTIVANSEPSVICAYGDESQIELASTSKTLGIDLKALTISALLDQLKSGTPKTVTP